MAFEVSYDWDIAPDTITFREDTGDYHVTTNPTGYSTPNPDFADYAHYAIVRKKGVNGTDDEVLTLETYNPLTATEFVAPRLTDGWYEGNSLKVTKWTAGTYAAGIVRYYSGSIYIAATSTSATPGADADWTLVTDLEDIEGNDSVEENAFGKVTAYNADVYWSRQIALNSSQGKCGICSDDRQKLRLDNIKFHVAAALIADLQGNYTDGEWNVLSLIQLGAV